MISRINLLDYKEKYMFLFRIGDDVLYLIKSRASPSLASLGQRQISDVKNR